MDALDGRAGDAVHRGGIGLAIVKPILMPISVIAFVHAWAIPELYAARGAGVVRAGTPAGGAADRRALGLLGDLIGPRRARAPRAHRSGARARRARGVAARRGGRTARPARRASHALLLREGDRPGASRRRPDRPSAAGAARRTRPGSRQSPTSRSQAPLAGPAAAPETSSRRAHGCIASRAARAGGRPGVGPSGPPRFRKFVPRANVVFRPREHDLSHDTSNGNFQGDAPRGPSRRCRCRPDRLRSGATGSRGCGSRVRPAEPETRFEYLKRVHD